MLILSGIKCLIGNLSKNHICVLAVVANSLHGKALGVSGAILKGIANELIGDVHTENFTKQGDYPIFSLFHIHFYQVLLPTNR